MTSKGHKHPKNLSVMKSPLSARLPAWQASLSSHPDKDFATVVMEDLQHGSWVGFDHSGWLQPDCQNMPSAEQHPEITDQYLEAELTAGCILGPINWLGVVPKSHTSRKWHLIIDLSFPEWANVNGGIDSHFCFIQPDYVSYFLGIEIDTTSGLMHLPEEKLACLHQALQSWA